METNKIYNMNCLDGMKQIPDGSIDMILCDLPYGTTKCKWDNLIDSDSLWFQYERIIKDNGAILLFAKQPFTTDLINSGRKLYRYSLVWIKNIGSGFLNAKIMPIQNHEDICVFYKKKPTYNPIMEDGFDRKISRVSSKRKCKSAEAYGKAVNIKDHDSTMRYPISILYFESDKQKGRLHPTQKPILLLENLIKTYSNEDDTILDNCMGSGSTAIACINTKRNYIGFELDENYYNIANQRITNQI